MGPLLIVGLLSACSRTPGRPHLWDAPYKTSAHGRFTLDSYEDLGWGEQGNYHFDVLKVDGEPIYYGDTVLQGGVNFCDEPGIDAVGLYLRSMDPEVHGTWVLQLQGDTPHWTRLCGRYIGAVPGRPPWEGARYHDPGCRGLVYDATTMAVVQVGSEASPSLAPTPDNADTPPAQP